MSDFEQRLQKAIERGQQRGERKAEEARRQQLNEEELKRLHSQHRLALSEHIEQATKLLPNHFPGFRLETIFGEKGWGAAVSRDDLRITNGRRDNDYSRLELTIRPPNSYHVVDLAGKATIRNKEVFNRNHFEKIENVDPDTFKHLIDVWVLEFAELYSAAQ
ncbi:MAG: hypothetical protein R3C99_07540 [Pirellulaceae bacterium]|nr:hypothetical protein [Planctomycetales bacterium]MCA9204284.1 hypothetical protein [Planctomycetales bacterium]MCA9208335.1 hypothetical protein [Planctomycetales bacterium]MCA9219687.1 hypothetical protein [Planctomycetales bacterium]